MSEILQGNFPPKPLDRVVSVEGSVAVARTRGRRFNFDDLIGTRGLFTYRKMRLDEQVKAVMVFKRDAIFARGWCFEFDEDTTLSEAEQQTRVEAFKRIVQRIPGSFVDGLNCIATGRDFGYSVTEKVYTQLSDGKGGTLIGIGGLLGRDPTSFVFDTDEFGQLRSCRQEIGGRRIDIDLTNFIHYVHNPEFDVYFGRSDLREAYKAWFWKTRMMDYWMTFGERLAGGFAVASTSTEANLRYGSQEWSYLEDAINNLSSVNGMILPPGVTLDLKSPASSDFYEKAVEFFDLGIARSLLVPNLLGVSHTGQTGAYSQSQTQLEAFFWTLNSDKQRLEATINEQLFKDLGDQNWGDDDYPQFKFNELSSERLKWTVESWSKLAQVGSVLVTEKDEAKLREMLNMPPREEGAQQLAEAKFQPPVPATLGPAAAGEARPGTESANPPLPPGVDPPAAPVASPAAEMAALREDMATLLRFYSEASAPQAPAGPPRDKAAATQRAATRVHFAVIDDRQRSMGRSMVAATAAFLARGVKQLLGTDADLALLTDADVADIADIEFSTSQKGKLKANLARALSESYALGRDMAGNELERAHARYTREKPEAPLPFARAAFTDIRDKAVAYFDANAFRMAGNLTETTRGVIQGELQNAVKFGKSPPEARADIWKALLKKGLVSMGSVRDVESEEIVGTVEAAWMVSEDAAAAYLDTLARTNLFEAMNEARFAEFTDPAVADFVEGLEYSAILDERTTHICESLDGAQYRADNEAIWDKYRPPNHYNCRSLLIPITTLDDWDGVESPAPTVEPQEGFK